MLINLEEKMKKINLDYSKVFKFIDENELQSIKVEVEKAARVLEEKSGKGNDFLGWLDLPIN